MPPKLALLGLLLLTSCGAGKQPTEGERLFDRASQSLSDLPFDATEQEARDIADHKARLCAPKGCLVYEIGDVDHIFRRGHLIGKRLSVEKQPIQSIRALGIGTARDFDRVSMRIGRFLSARKVDCMVAPKSGSICPISAGSGTLNIHFNADKQLQRIDLLK